MIQASFETCHAEAEAKGATPAQAAMVMPTILPPNVRDPGQPLAITCKNTAPIRGRDAFRKKKVRNEEAVAALRADLTRAHSVLEELGACVQDVINYPTEYAISPDALARIRENVEVVVVVIGQYAALLAKCTAKQGEDGHYCTFNAPSFQATLRQALSGTPASYNVVESALELLTQVCASFKARKRPPSSLMGAVRTGMRAMTQHVSAGVARGVQLIVAMATELARFIWDALWKIRRNLFIAGIAIAVPYLGAAFLYHFKYLETMHGVYSFWSTINTIGAPLCRVYHSTVPIIMTGLLLFDIIVGDTPLADALDTLIRGTVTSVLHGAHVGARVLEIAVGGLSGALGTVGTVAAGGGAFDLRSMAQSLGAVRRGAKPSALLNQLLRGKVEWIDKLLQWKGAPLAVRDSITAVFAPALGRGTLAVTVQWIMMRVVTPFLYRIMQWTCTMTRGKAALAEGAGRVAAAAVDAAEAVGRGDATSAAIGWLQTNLVTPVLAYLQDAVAWGSDTARRLGPEAAAYKARQADLATLKTLTASHPMQALLKSLDTQYADVLRRYVDDAAAAWGAAARPAVAYKPTRDGAALDFAALYAAVHAPPEMEEVEGAGAGLGFDMAGLLGKRVVHVEIKTVPALAQANKAGYILHTRVDQVTYLECAVLYFWMVHGVSYPRTKAMLLLLVCGVLLMALLLYYFRRKPDPRRELSDLLNLFDIDTAQAEAVLGASMDTLIKEGASEKLRHAVGELLAVARGTPG